MVVVYLHQQRPRYQHQSLSPLSPPPPPPPPPHLPPPPPHLPPPPILLQQVIESGPVPFSNYCSVTFLAEQVSHHPPGKKTPPPARFLILVCDHVAQCLDSMPSAHPRECLLMGLYTLNQSFLDCLSGYI